MPYRSPTGDSEIEFTDRYGDKRVLHRSRGTGPLKVKRTRVTPVLALNQTIAALVGKRVKKLRLERGYELAELCTRSGIVSATPKSRMWEIENSVRQQGLRLGTIYALAMALGVEVCDLMPAVVEVQKVARPETAEQTAVVLTTR